MELSEQALNTTGDRLRAQKRANEKLEKKITLLEEQVLDKQAQLDTYVKNLLDERKASRDKEAVLKRERMTAMEMKNKAQVAENKREEAENKLTVTRDRYLDAEARNAEKEEKIAELNGTIKDLGDEIAGLKEEIEERESRIKALEVRSVTRLSGTRHWT